MPKKTTTDIVPKPTKRLPPRTPEEPLVTGFENKVGRYELTRVDGGQAYYSFTNLQGRTADAIMSVTMWRRMQARADATFQEIT